MSISAGATLGPYEILAPLGSGGMGDVYRARDPRLGRDVAVKVLPPAFASDPNRLARFEQEARAVAALNHPNIVAIYDVGKDPEGRPYLVTELIEGTTLRTRLSDEPLPLRQAVDFGLQIAHGLAAAHDRGIVHRDLKPENLFVTKDRRVKILDFGLAKVVGPRGGIESTIAVGATESGTVLGTVGYMAPEQVRGETADHRSDLFAFGSILYEMIAGRRAFQALTAAETMTAILRSDPPPMGAPGQIPSSIERVVRHCLEKTPGERYQSAHDLAFQLEGALGPGDGAEGAARAKPRGRWLAVTALLAAIVGGLLAVAPRWLSPPAKPPEFHRVTFRPGFAWSGRFAPDGRTIVYSAAWGEAPLETYSTRPESPESRALGLKNASILSISKSGEMAVLLDASYAGGWAYRGTLARVPLEGGAPREILDSVLWADWEPGGRDLAVVRESGGERRLEYPIGKVLYKAAGTIGEPRFSPKGDLIAFLDHPIFGDDRGSVSVVDRRGSVRRLTSVWKSIQGIAWAPGGKEIWFTAADEGPIRALYAVTPGGRLRTVMNPPGSLSLQDISPSGGVLLAEWRIRYGITGRSGADAGERDLSWLDWSAVRDFSHDGTQILFSEGGEGGGPSYGVYLRPTDGSPAVRLGEGETLALSPDGQWVLSVPRGDKPHPVLLPTGAGQARSLPAGPLHEYQNGTWLKDGRVLLEASEPGHGNRYYVQDVNGGMPQAVTPENVAGFGFGAHTASPDGRKVIARGPGGSIAMWPLGPGEPTPVSGLVAGDVPIRWADDGRTLYVARAAAGRRELELARVDLPTGRRTLWKELVPRDAIGATRIGSPMVSPDGKAYAYTYGSHTADLYLVEGLR
ncbi:MAG TPA: protein kinase [Candidatus Eisenbacteria bacterium]|nr:protein kinase [Candidatus Eisenbacteria bacterium]